MRAAAGAAHEGAHAGAHAEGATTDPEERLAFALSDGRVGVLAVKGRKVYKPFLVDQRPLITPVQAVHRCSVGGCAHACTACRTLPVDAGPPGSGSLSREL